MLKTESIEDARDIAAAHMEKEELKKLETDEEFKERQKEINQKIIDTEKRKLEYYQNLRAQGIDKERARRISQDPFILVYDALKQKFNL